MDVPAVTVNSVCLSGIHAIHLAHQLIRSGEADVVVAGGMESMSQAPYLLPGARAGYRLGDVTAVDAMIRDGLWCAFDDVHMGAGTEAYAKAAGITRARQDELAAMSHQRACIATKEGRLADEIVPVTVRQRQEELVVDTDEGIRPDTTVDGLARLKPAFSPDGTITAGNASQISDGAAAVVVDEPGQGRRAGTVPPGRARRLRPGRRPRPVAAHPAVAGHPAGARTHRPPRRRRRPVRDQRGVRGRGGRVHRRPRHRRRRGQRQRRGHRPRPPHRHVGHPPGDDAGGGAAPGRRRPGGGGPVRRRRPGRGGTGGGRT